ncbi:MAG: hypothetical protein ACI8XM_000298 [Haloarculaceae archaeon]|jgi:hypothetical protein
MSGLGDISIGAGLLFALPSAAARNLDWSVSGERFVRFGTALAASVIRGVIASAITIR